MSQINDTLIGKYQVLHEIFVSTSSTKQNILKKQILEFLILLRTETQSSAIIIFKAVLSVKITSKSRMDQTNCTNTNICKVKQHISMQF